MAKPGFEPSHKKHVAKHASNYVMEMSLARVKGERPNGHQRIKITDNMSIWLQSISHGTAIEYKLIM